MWILLLFILLILLYSLIQQTYSKYRKYPPGPIRWPIVGSIPQMLMIDHMFPHKQLTGLANKYGPIVSIGLGKNFTVVLNTYDMMKLVLKRPETFQRFQSAYSEERTNGENLGIIWGKGTDWKEIRKFTTKGLREFGFGKIRSLQETFKEEIEMLLEDIRDEISTTNGIWTVESHRLSIVAINILWSSVGGFRFDQKSDVIKEHIQLIVETLQMLNPAHLITLFPFLKLIPKWSGYDRLQQLHQRSRNFMKQLIEDAKYKRQNPVEPQSFVEVFLDEIEMNKGNSKSYMTEKQLVTILMDLFLAGSDTTGTALNWLILYFAIYQRVQNKVREEIQSASKNWTTSLTVAQASCLPYLRCCIYETFRHSPFLPLPAPRVANNDIEVAGYYIKKGTCVVSNFHGAFHEKAFWGENVDEFWPERFLNSTGTTLDPDKVEHIAQFGFAPRHCLGEKIVMYTMTAAALGLLKKFQIRLVEGRKATLELSNPSAVVAPKPYVVKLDPIRMEDIVDDPMCE